MNFNLEDCIAFLTLSNSKILSDKFERMLAMQAITKSQWIAMYYIKQNDGLLVNEIAGKMGLKSPTIVRMLDNMELLKWIKRDNNSDDKRTKLIHLTEKGLTKYEEILPTVICFKTSVTKGISQDNLNTFKAVLCDMVKNTNQL